MHRYQLLDEQTMQNFSKCNANDVRGVLVLVLAYRCVGSRCPPTIAPAALRLCTALGHLGLSQQRLTASAADALAAAGLGSVPRLLMASRASLRGALENGRAPSFPS